MRQFFYTVFGGLVAIVAGLTIAYGGHLFWKEIRPKLPPLSVSFLINKNVASAGSETADGTTISGFARTVRYTAAEEEDLISNSIEILASSPISATGYIITNLTRGGVVAEKQADRIMPIASLTKLVTATVARQRIDEDELITISRKIMSTYGNTAQFKVGETFRREDLLYPLLMVSSNDAAEALARSTDRRAFIRAMNDFAQSIGAYRTYFEDPSGLSPRNISTARDLALIIDWIRKNDPEVISITAEKARIGRAHTWINPTHFLNWSTYLGGKNGYTPEANRTGVALFTLGARKDTYAVVVLGSEVRDSDVIKLIDKVK